MFSLISLVFKLQFKMWRFLFTKKIVTIPRLIIIYIVLPVFVLVDIIGTAFVYMIPKFIWPPLKPAMTFEQVVKWLGATVPGTNTTNHWLLTTKLFTERPPGFWLAQIPFIFVLCIILIIFYRTGWPYRRPALLMSKETTHGSSRWRRFGELSKTLTKVDTDKPKTAGIVVASEGNTAWLTNPKVGNPHTIIIGATRSGKTRRVILPSIWSIGNSGESMIISDPKGELYQYTSAWLKQKGYEVILLDLLKPVRGNRWNPLDVINKALKGGDEEEAVRQAWELGNMMAWSKGGGTDPIWPQAEESLIAALFLAVATEAPENQKHPASAYTMLMELGMDGGEALDEYFAHLPQGHPAKMAYGTAGLSESRTRSSIYTGTAAHLRLFSESGIGWLCAESDHNPQDAGKKSTAIFLLLPDEAGARRDIAAMYVNQAYSSLAQLARDSGGKLPIPVWFLLDEFGNIGRVPNLPEKLTVSAGRNIRFVMAVQSLAQLEHVYGRKEAEIVQGNCDTWLYLRTSDIETAQVISRMTGTFTVRTKSMQRRRADVSESEGTTSRYLLTPDEILRWQMGQSLLLQPGQFPARLPLQDLSEWKEATVNFKLSEFSKVFNVEKIKTWVPEVSSQQEDKENLNSKEQSKTTNILNDLSF